MKHTIAESKEACLEARKALLAEEKGIHPRRGHAAQRRAPLWLPVTKETYRYLDLAPKGRDEDQLPWTMSWLRFHDEFGA